jgi:hypothetical protein
MAILGGSAIDGIDKIQLLDDDTGSEVKVLVDDLFWPVPYVSTKRDSGSETPMA